MSSPFHQPSHGPSRPVARASQLPALLPAETPGRGGAGKTNRAPFKEFFMALGMAALR